MHVTGSEEGLTFATTAHLDLNSCMALPSLSASWCVVFDHAEVEVVDNSLELLDLLCVSLDFVLK